MFVVNLAYWLARMQIGFPISFFGGGFLSEKIKIERLACYHMIICLFTLMNS